ncbi:hypothetical protein GCM10027296_39120 [Chitinimonas naiadis]
MHFYLVKADGYLPYSGVLPVEMKSEDGVADILSRFGNPDRAGGDKQDGLMGYLNKWFRYSVTGGALRFEFSREDKIVLVTLMAV